MQKNITYACASAQVKKYTSDEQFLSIAEPSKILPTIAEIEKFGRRYKTKFN